MCSLSWCVGVNLEAKLRKHERKILKKYSLSAPD